MRRSLLQAASCLAVLAGPALSQPAPSPGASQGAQPVQGPSEGNAPGAPAARGSSPSGATGAGENAANASFDKNLLGDPGAIRSRLAAHGVTLGLTEISEVFGNVTGGIRTGFDYEGATEAGLGIDTEKAFGLVGGTFNVTAYQFHGRGLTVPNIGSLGFISGVEQTTRGAKLFELWYEQLMFDKKVGLRVGQMSVDQEFITTEYGGLFLNSGYGFPTLGANDLPSGGPDYPLGTPGIRLKVVPSESVAVLAAILNGNPAGPGLGDPQKRDGGGTAFRVNDGSFVIGEVEYSLNSGDKAPGLPGTYKLGAWYNSLPFADQRYSFTGAPLGDPANAAAPRSLRNNYSVYAVMDQLVWKKPGTPDGGVAVFARAMGAPPDRNLVDVFVQGGVTYKAPFPGRENDTVGVAASWAHVSQRAAKFDSDAAAFTGQPIPVRRSETQIEVTYQAQLAAWLQVQPDFQYILNPGAGIANPRRPGRRVGDAAILGLRGTVTF